MFKETQNEFRADLFRHLDGIVTAPSAFALHQKGVTNYILEKQNVSLKELTEKFKANEGYLNVALRVLCSQGWLIQNIDNRNDRVEFAVNERTAEAFRYFHLYEDAVDFLKSTEQFRTRRSELETFLVLEKVFKGLRKNYGVSETENSPVAQQICKHIEGIIVGPASVYLGMSGMFHKYFMQAHFRPEEFHTDPDSFGRLLDFFVHFNWFLKQNGTYQFTEKGLFFARRSTAYGVTVSYIPTLRKLDELIFGNPNAARAGADAHSESHVDRKMNVWGSGGTHATYFKIVDDIVIELFNKRIEDQPKGIVDMGCGNGMFLQHLYQVIEQQTARGKVLDEHPLILIGADFNEAALQITKANLIQADIWAKVIWGDVGRPDLLAKDLKENYNIDLKELLNVRTFLDHNRRWKEPTEVDPNRVSESTGAFAFEGKRINNNRVEESLKEHLKSWEPYINKFGLLIIELHTVDPKLVALNLGKTPATAYDATHGYSDQYIVELDVFNKVMAEVGLVSDKNFSHKFPNSDIATVTINLFRKNS